MGDASQRRAAGRRCPGAGVGSGGAGVPAGHPYGVGGRTNRGLKVWPKGAPETFCTDHWRCRFDGPGDASGIEQARIFELLTRIQQLIQTQQLLGTWVGLRVRQNLVTIGCADRDVALDRYLGAVGHLRPEDAFHDHLDWLPAGPFSNGVPSR